MFKFLALSSGMAALAAVLSGCASPHLQAGPRSFQKPALHDGHVALSDGYRLPLSTWLPESRPPRGVVLALHGFNDYRRAFQPLGAYLAGRGFATYAYDQRGFGGSPYRGIWPGSDRLVRDVREVLTALRRRYPDRPLYLVGESMGGAVAMIAANRGLAGEIDGMILLAPAVWGRATMSPLMRAALWVSVRTVPARRWTAEGLDIRPTDNSAALRRMARDPLVIKQTRTDALWGVTNLMDRAMARAGQLHGPALVLYGRRDEVIPIAPTCRMLSSLPEHALITLAVYDEGYHLLLQDTRAERVLRDIAAWLERPRAGLPDTPGRTTGAGARAGLCDETAP